MTASRMISRLRFRVPLQMGERKRSRNSRRWTTRESRDTRKDLIRFWFSCVAWFCVPTLNVLMLFRPVSSPPSSQHSSPEPWLHYRRAPRA
jgi:hypothetical protein